MRGVRSVRDAEIAGRVIHALAEDGRLNVADLVQVGVENGVVQLTGTVDSAEQKEAAREIAARVEGVREVRDSLVVAMSPYADDAELQASAEAEIAEAPGLSLKDVGVEVDDGIATLVGRVPDAAREQEAEAVAGEVKGVKEVVSDLLVGQARRDEVIEIVDDATLRSEVAGALADRGIVVFDDATFVADGVVHLRGHVFSQRDAREAERLARAIPGVQSVRDELVAEEEIPSRSPDEELAARVMDALGRNPEANPTYVKALAFGGDVYLVGQVDSIEQQIASIEAARRVPGVRRVLSGVVISDRTSVASDDKGTVATRRFQRRRLGPLSERQFRRRR